MIKNYLKIAYRNLIKHRTNSAVSIVGLSIGIACFLLLATYIFHELRYDDFQENKDRIARVNLMYQSGGGEAVNVAMTPTGLGPVFSREFEEIEKAVRIYFMSGNVPVKYQDKVLNERGLFFTDSTFFQVFSFPFVVGDPKTALSQPNTIVLDQTTAKKYFGSENPIGKTVELNGKYNLQVTGVVADVPSYSSIKFHGLASYSTLPRSRSEAFDSANEYTYLLLKPQASWTSLQRKIDRYVKDHLNDAQNPDSKLGFNLEKFSRIHLYSEVSAGLESPGNHRYVKILSVVAILILLIACINFVNLVTARSVVRAREVGVRKALGAERSQVFGQYLYECGIITLTSMIVGFVIATLAFPSLSNLTSTRLNLGVWPGASLPVFAVAVFIIVTILAGLYPAAVLSRFEPIKVLKGNMFSPKGGNRLRSFLVVFQFSVSVLFIVGTLVANQQMNYIRNKKLGVDPSQIVVLDLGTGIPSQKIASIKQALLSNASVKSVSASYDTPLNIQGGYSISAADKPEGFEMSITAIPVEKDFVKTLGMKLVVGEDFSDADILKANVDSFALREYPFILNESAAKALGWKPQEAIGKMVNMNGRRGPVKAVAEDFHFRSLHEKIGPIAMIPEYDYFGKLLVKTSGTEASENVIKNLWTANFPGMPLELHFLNEEFDTMYQAENRVSSLLTIFSGITILITCLGLFALIAFIVQQRTKEIGIRKVLGATATNVVVLLSQEFVKLTLIALVIASPLAWYVMNEWLGGFAYRINIGWWVFALTAIISLAVAFFTVGFQTFKASLANPVKSLKSEL